MDRDALEQRAECEICGRRCVLAGKERRGWEKVQTDWCCGGKVVFAGMRAAEELRVDTMHRERSSAQRAIHHRDTPSVHSDSRLATEVRELSAEVETGGVAVAPGAGDGVALERLGSLARTVKQMIVGKQVLGGEWVADALLRLFRSGIDAVRHSAPGVGADAAEPEEWAEPMLDILAACTLLGGEMPKCVSDQERASAVGAIAGFIAVWPHPWQAVPGRAGTGPDCHAQGAQAMLALAVVKGSAAAGASASDPLPAAVALEAVARIGGAVFLLNLRDAAAHAQRCHSLLRILFALLQAAKEAAGPAVDVLMHTLPPLFTYGRQPVAEPPEAADKYVPPGGRRRRRRSSSCSSSGMVSGQELGSSDSDSDTGGGGSRGSGRTHDRAAQVRLLALSCVQALARHKLRTLQAHWSRLLPSAPPAVPGSQAWGGSLVDVVLRDSAAKNRAAAALTLSTLLDGKPQALFLAIADASDARAPGPRSFLALSAALGQALVWSFDGLRAALAAEAVPAVAAAVLRCVASLVSASPCARLPARLLPEMLDALLARLLSLPRDGCAGADSAALLLPLPPLPPGTALAAAAAAMPELEAEGAAAAQDQAAVCAALAGCLKAVFGTDTPARSVAEHLQRMRAAGEPVDAALDVLYAQAAAQPCGALQTELVGALRGLTCQCFSCVCGRWQHTLRIAQLNLRHVLQPEDGGGASSAMERLAAHSLRLLCDWLQQAAAAGDPPAAASVQQVVVPALRHGPDAVRAAAASLLAMPGPQAEARPCAVQLLAEAAGSDPAASVRSACCRSLALMPLAGGGAAAATLRACAADSALSVRVAAAVALAAICHSLAALPEPWAAACVAAVGSVEALHCVLAAVLAGCGDVDKVRSHAVRALGCLLLRVEVDVAAAAPPFRAAPPLEPPGGFLDAAVAALQAGLSMGSPKVQWNAAFAARCALANRSLAHHSPLARFCLAAWLPLLLGLLRGSSNFKTRIQACSALLQLPEARLFGEHLAPALRLVASTLEAEWSSTAPPAITAIAIAASPPLSGDGSSCAPAAARPADSADAGDALEAGPSSGGGDRDSFLNYQYHAALMQQLQACLLRLLGFAQPEHLKHLEAKLPFLQVVAEDAGRQLLLLLRAHIQQAEEQAALRQQQGNRQADELRGDWHHRQPAQLQQQLPPDPFDQGSSSPEPAQSGADGSPAVASASVPPLVVQVVTAALAGLQRLISSSPLGRGDGPALLQLQTKLAAALQQAALSDATE